MNQSDRQLIRDYCKKVNATYSSARKAWSRLNKEGRNAIRHMMEKEMKKCQPM